MSQYTQLWWSIVGFMCSLSYSVEPCDDVPWQSHGLSQRRLQSSWVTQCGVPKHYLLLALPAIISSGVNKKSSTWLALDSGAGVEQASEDRFADDNWIVAFENEWCIVPEKKSRFGSMLRVLTDEEVSYTSHLHALTRVLDESPAPSGESWVAMDGEFMVIYSAKPLSMSCIKLMDVEQAHQFVCWVGAQRSEDEGWETLTPNLISIFSRGQLLRQFRLSRAWWNVN